MAYAPVPANLNIFFTVADTALQSLFYEVDKDVPSPADEYASDKSFESLTHEDAWQGVLPKARLWSGSRVVHTSQNFTYSVTSLPAELTVGIDRFTKDADLYGLFDSILPNMARSARRHKDYWCRDLLEAAGNFTSAGSGNQQNPQIGLDGLPFFSTAHPQNFYTPGSVTTVSNDFTGGGINVPGGLPGGSGNNILVGGAFNVTAFMSLAEYMMGYRGQDNEVLGVMPNIAMFSNSLFGEAQLALTANSFAPPAWATFTNQVGAADNPLKKYGVRPVINPFLNNGQKWYLADTKRSQRAVRWGIHEGWRVAYRTNETDEPVFTNHEYQFGYWGHFVPFWGFFWLMARSGP